MRLCCATMLVALLAATADASLIGIGEAFEFGSVVYTVGGETSNQLVLLRWNAVVRRFENVPLPDGQTAPAAEAIVRMDTSSLAFIGQSGEGRWAVWTLRFDPSGRLIEARRGPDWPFTDRITGLHRIRDGFVVVGAASAAILDDRGYLRCGWSLRSIRVETFTSDVRDGLLIVGPDTLAYSVRCPASVVSRPLKYRKIQGVSAAREGWLFTVRSPYRRIALLAFDPSFRPLWTAKLPNLPWRLAGRGSSTVLWEWSSSTAFVVDAHGAVSELRIPFADGDVDVIDSLRGGDVSFLTRRGPVVARRVGSVETHQVFAVPGTQYWLTIEDLLLVSLAVLVAAVSMVLLLRYQKRRSR